MFCKFLDYIAFSCPPRSFNKQSRPAFTRVFPFQKLFIYLSFHTAIIALFPLSVKGKYGTVVRPMRVTVKATDRNGKDFTVKAEGFLARAFCHEYDHLEGVIYIDKAESVYEVKK